MASENPIEDIEVPDISRCVQTAIHERTFSAGAVIASVGGKVFHRKVYGTPTAPPPHLRLREPVFFDLGTLTFPLGSGLAALYLASRSRIDLNASLSTTIPEFRDKKFKDITIDMLLDHSAGFAATRRFHETMREEEEAIPESAKKVGKSAGNNMMKRLFAESRIAGSAGHEMLESELSGMALGWIVEGLCNRPLDMFLEREIFKPLGLHEELFFVRNDDPRLRMKHGRKTFVATRECEWREEVMQGQVDCSNAWAMGGVAGHAGLFGTVDAVWRLVHSLWASNKGHGRDFLGGTVRRFWTRSRRLKNTTRALSWNTPVAHGASCGNRFSMTSVGADGNTGCSIWVDMSTDTIGVFLGNAAHPSLDGKEDALEKFRPRLFDHIAKHGDTVEPDEELARGAAAFSNTTIRR